MAGTVGHSTVRWCPLGNLLAHLVDELHPLVGRRFLELRELSGQRMSRGTNLAVPRTVVTELAIWPSAVVTHRR